MLQLFVLDKLKPPLQNGGQLILHSTQGRNGTTGALRKYSFGDPVNPLV